MDSRTLALVATLLSGFTAGACRSQDDAPPTPPAASEVASTIAVAAGAHTLPDERHLADLTQLTFGGENAEAYWSFAGDQLVLQARIGDAKCDRIYRMSPAAAASRPTALVPVSSGAGATTCAYFLPGDGEVIYASTHLAGAECPPRPDHSQGYVWALHDGYDIFRAKADGTDVRRLTDTPGYDAEATVCAKDGSIVFTSVRDGDLELYRMDADGSNVRRLTHEVGYDGGAFFDADCERLVWRASRPRPGAARDDYQRLLAQGLVRPSKLEIVVADADGSEARQITWLDAASFGPSWFPGRRDRIIFSSNYGDPKGREFDLFAIDADGTDLERITFTPGFDGFPHFAPPGPDGDRLAFSSNRATAEGAHDTNVFVARWVDAPAVAVAAEPAPADRIMSDIAWLADPLREGRGLGLAGLHAAGAWLETRMRELGLDPAGDEGGFRQHFNAVTGLTRGAATRLAIGGRALAESDYVVLGHSPVTAHVEAPVVFADYGIVAPELGRDDYAGRDVAGKIALVRRFVPDTPAFSATEVERRYSDIRYKAWLAREHGAAGLLVVDDPAPPEPRQEDWSPPMEASLPALAPEGQSDAGLPVIVLKRAAGQALIAADAAGSPRVAIDVALEVISSTGFNVVGRIAAAPAAADKLPGVVVVGAHYDHLGLGGKGSLSPESNAPHLGADDNASGTAVLLEVARALAARRGELRRDVLVVAFSGEETGLLGSGHFVKAWPEQVAGGRVAGVAAMINMDMVGRMRGDRLQVLGAGTAPEWLDLVTEACAAARIDCGEDLDTTSDGYGPSDQTAFYAAGVPVLHLFTGAHADYHKPSDSADKINAAGAAAVAELVTRLVVAVSQRDPGLTLRAGSAGPAPRGDRRSFNASLGTIPNYVGPGQGRRGVLLDGVRAGGAADLAGMRRGDILVKLGKSDIGGVEDLMYVLNASKPGETVTAEVLRDDARLVLEVTFQEGKRRPP